MAGNADVTATLRLRAKDESAAAFRSLAGKFDAVERKSRQVERATAASMRAGRTASKVSMIERASVRTEAALLARASTVLAPAAIAYGAVKSVARFAEVERQVERIGITAGATAEQTKSAFGVIDRAAFNFATSQDDITAGLDTLVATGRDMKDALSFLPSITATAVASGAAITDIAQTADSVGRNFDIAGDKMQSAFDIMNAGGKSGQFELKDMAAYLPSAGAGIHRPGLQGREGAEEAGGVASGDAGRNRFGKRSGNGTAECCPEARNERNRQEIQRVRRRPSRRDEKGAARRQGSDRDLRRADPQDRRRRSFEAAPALRRCAGHHRHAGAVEQRQADDERHGPVEQRRRLDTARP